MRFLSFIVVGCTLPFVAVISANIEVQAAIQDDATVDKRNPVLGQMLTRLGLDRLELRRAELELSRELDTSKRKLLARELAEHYYRFLLASISSSIDNRTDNILGRAENLIQNYPEIESPNLRLAMTHAEYQSLEVEFGRWWTELASPKGRDTVITGFRHILSSIDRQIQANENLRKDVLNEIPLDDVQAAHRQRKLSEVEGRLLHAHFLKGWTCYFLAVAPLQQDERALQQAVKSFCHTLQIERQQPIESIDKKWLELSSPLNRRALLGLALVNTAQQRSTASQYCFRVIAPYGVENEYQIIWPFYGLIYSRQWAAAIDFLDSQDPQSVWPSQLKQRLWTSAYIAGRIAGSTHPQNGRTLQARGLMGILRMGNPALLTAIAQDHNLQLRNDVFADRWISGVLAQHQGDTHDDSKQQAREHFIAALALATPQTRHHDLSRIRFQLASIEHECNDFVTSLARLNELPADRRQLPLNIAENVFWLKYQNQLELARGDVRRIGPALAALNRWAAEFPDSKFSAQIAFDRLKLSNRLLPPTEALQKLQQIPASSRHFSEARFEMVKAQYQVWSQAFSQNATDEAAVYAELVASDHNYRSLSQITSKQKLASVFFVVDACLRRDSQIAEFERWLAIAENLTLDTVGRSQLMYYRFQAAKKFKDDKAAGEAAHWLSKHAIESDRQIAGMIYLAQRADQSNERSNVELLELYENLAERLGTDDTSLSQSRNARVVAGRLTDLYLVGGDFELAAALNNRLKTLFPNRQRFQLTAARIQMGRNDLQAALPFWRRLARGSQAGSDVWLESKLGVVECLLMLDPQMAQKVLRQTKRLADPVPSAWKARFEQLENRLLVAVEQVKTPN